MYFLSEFVKQKMLDVYHGQKLSIQEKMVSVKLAMWRYEMTFVEGGCMHFTDIQGLFKEMLVNTWVTMNTRAHLGNETKSRRQEMRV